MIVPLCFGGHRFIVFSLQQNIPLHKCITFDFSVIVCWEFVRMTFQKRIKSWHCLLLPFSQCSFLTLGTKYEVFSMILLINILSLMVTVFFSHSVFIFLQSSNSCPDNLLICPHSNLLKCAFLACLKLSSQLPSRSFFLIYFHGVYHWLSIKYSFIYLWRTFISIEVLQRSKLCLALFSQYLSI